MDGTGPIVSRIIFNFTSRCNLPCEFCYVPFDSQDDGNLQLWQKIVARCKEWKPKIITFGGGDPFMYRDFPLLLQSTQDGRVFVQVDTNALAISEQDIPIIKETVQLVGLPIDGTPETHATMRGHPFHFRVVLRMLQRLTEEGVPVKVNTIVSRLNIQDLEGIARLLMQFPIRDWALYQFWPIGPGRQHRARFELSREEFLSATQFLREKYDFTRVEISPISVRLLSYFFVSHTGRVYVMDKDNHEEYAELGSIFDEEILVRWQEHGKYDLVTARADLRTSIV